jgi:DNA-directed RNA polymerase I, II, and III subunit RPABC3
LNGQPDDGNYNPSHGSSSSLLDNYDYAMHGRVFSIRHVERQCVEVQASFGGLLCRLKGEQAHMEAFLVDMP